MSDQPEAREPRYFGSLKVNGDTVTFRGETAAEFRKAFVDSLMDYEEFRAEVYAPTAKSHVRTMNEVIGYLDKISLPETDRVRVRELARKARYGSLWFFRPHPADWCGDDHVLAAELESIKSLTFLCFLLSEHETGHARATARLAAGRLGRVVEIIESRYNF